MNKQTINTLRVLKFIKDNNHVKWVSIQDELGLHSMVITAIMKNLRGKGIILHTKGNGYSIDSNALQYNLSTLLQILDLDYKVGFEDIDKLTKNYLYRTRIGLL